MGSGYRRWSILLATEVLSFVTDGLRFGTTPEQESQAWPGEEIPRAVCRNSATNLQMAATRMALARSGVLAEASAVVQMPRCWWMPRIAKWGTCGAGASTQRTGATTSSRAICGQGESC